MAEKDFDVFAKKMRRLGLDDESIDLIFDKFSGATATVEQIKAAEGVRL